MADISELLGHVLTRVVLHKNESLDFYLEDGRIGRLYHAQYCCESVSIEDVAGDLDDLVGVPLAMAEESSNREEPIPEESDGSHTWTFYRFRTIKGDVTLRWLGMSNGYYSERVDFDWVEPPEVELLGGVEFEEGRSAGASSI